MDRYANGDAREADCALRMNFHRTWESRRQKPLWRMQRSDPEEIDFIIVATLTPDYLCPNTACLIQQAIGAKRAGAVDLAAACTGFLYALAMAKSFVEAGMYQNVLVIASEKLSSITNYKDRSTCILFGDGAGACVVSSKGNGLAISSIQSGRRWRAGRTADPASRRMPVAGICRDGEK